MRSLIGIAALLIAATASAQSAPPRSSADSIVLERTLCFGTCPAYRLSIAADGRVSFESRNPGDTTRATDRIESTALAMLNARAIALPFYSLPDTIAKSYALCPDHATDHHTATVTIFAGASSKHVVDYHGCFARSDHSTVPVVGMLRAFERSIDSTANSSRWVRPARRPR